MINLDFFKKIGPKTILIVGLFVIIIVFLIIKLLVKQPPVSEQPIPPILPTTNPYAGLPSLPPTVPPPDQQIQQERIDDPLLNQEVVEFIAINSWYKQLPLVAKSYIAIFDWKKQAIRVSLNLDTASPLSKEEQTAKIKEEATIKLKNIGVDLNKIQVYYTFTP